MLKDLALRKDIIYQSKLELVTLIRVSSNMVRYVSCKICAINRSCIEYHSEKTS
jgi:hypothetical protein